MKEYQRFAIGALVIIAAALITFGVYNRFAKRVAQEEPGGIASPAPTPAQGFPVPEVSPPPTQPDSGTNTNSNIGIQIIAPQNGSSATSPLTVRGLANVDGGIVTITVKDQNGKALGKTNIFGCMGTDFCSFEAKVTFVKPQTASGYLEAESASLDNPDFFTRLTITF